MSYSWFIIIAVALYLILVLLFASEAAAQFPFSSRTLNSLLWFPSIPHPGGIVYDSPATSPYRTFL